VSLFGHEKVRVHSGPGTQSGTFERADKGTLMLTNRRDEPEDPGEVFLRVLNGNPFDAGPAAQARRQGRCAGVSGHESRDLKKRWQGTFRRDVLFRAACF